MLFLLWFMGARYYVGCDFGSYLNRFQNLPVDFDLASALISVEPGFEILISGIRSLGLDYMWLNMTAATITLAAYFVFLRHHYNPLMILALLFPIIILQLSMSGIRQGIAVALLMLATVHFQRGERFLTGLWILLGAQFHASVLMFLPIAFLVGRQVTTVRLIVGVILFTPLVAILMGDRITTYQDRYIDQVYGDMSSGGAFVRYGLSLVPSVLFFSLRRKLRVVFPTQYELMKIFSLITLSLLPVGLVSSLILHRLNFYIMPFCIMTLVAMSHVAFPRSQQLLGRLLPALIYGGYSLSWQMTSRHADICFIPYQNYLFLF